MSRTLRRRNARHEYTWVMSDFVFIGNLLTRIRIDRHSSEGRRLINRFHADGGGQKGPPPFFRRSHNKRLDTANENELRRALHDPAYDPVFLARHKSSAKWAWW